MTFFLVCEAEHSPPSSAEGKNGEAMIQFLHRDNFTLALYNSTSG
jgi:hypothetical protein